MRLSVSVISTAVLHPNALAILKMIASVGMCSPRSILPIWERSMLARFASASWAMPRSVRNARTVAPKAWASSASKVVAPVGRPRWMDRFCIDRSVVWRHNYNHVIFNSFIQLPLFLCFYGKPLVRISSNRENHNRAFYDLRQSVFTPVRFYDLTQIASRLLHEGSHGLRP